MSLLFARLRFVASNAILAELARSVDSDAVVARSVDSRYKRPALAPRSL